MTDLETFDGWISLQTMAQQVTTRETDFARKAWQASRKQMAEEAALPSSYVSGTFSVVVGPSSHATVSLHFSDETAAWKWFNQLCADVDSRSLATPTEGKT